jgi:adenylate cyclase
MQPFTLVKTTLRLSWRWRSLLGCLVVVTAVLGSLMPFHRLEESQGLRFWYSLRGVKPAPDSIVIVALNSEASKALGIPNRPDQWPRALHAELVHGLKAQGARVIVFDLLFDRARDPQQDQQLAQALRQAGNVLLAEYVLREQTVLDSHIKLSTDQRLLPLPELAQSAYATAPFPLPKTAHGIVEFWSFAPGAGDEATLPLRVAALLQPERYRQYLQQMGLAVSAGIPDAAQLRQLRPHFTAAQAFNLYGPPGQIRTLPYHQALVRLSQPGDSTFQNKIVLVGFSEFNQPEQRDAYITAYSQADGLDISGVELMATATANLLYQEWLRRPGLAAHFFILITIGLCLILPWFRCQARLSLGLNAITAVLYLALGLWCFKQYYLWLPLISVLAVQWPLLIGAGLWANYRHSEQQRQSLHQALNRYLPGQIIDQLARDYKSQQGELYAVCLSSDLQGYTALAENRSPEQLRIWLNQYFEQVIAVISAHDGQVVDLTGDAMLALWVSGQRPALACVQALQAARALQTLPLPTRIGLHYGPIAFGEVGAGAHVELRAVGDIVNTSSRLQSANKSLQTRVLLSQQVACYLPPDAPIKRLGQLQLAGKQQSIEVFTLSQTDCAGWQGIKVLTEK